MTRKQKLRGISQHKSIPKYILKGVLQKREMIEGGELKMQAEIKSAKNGNLGKSKILT